MSSRRARPTTPRLRPAPRRLAIGLLAVAAALPLPRPAAAQISAERALVPPPRRGVGPTRWRSNVTVYIRRDPVAGRTRHEDLKKAVEAWQAALKDKNVKNPDGSDFTVTPVVLDESGNVPGTGAPPPNRLGTVTTEWVTDKTGEATSNHNDFGQGDQYTDGKVQITKGETANEAADRQKALAVMLHEMGHILGFDHVTRSGSVMQQDLASYGDLTKPGAPDLEEIGSVYTASLGAIDGTATALGGGLFGYTYDVRWLGGAPISQVDVRTGGAPILTPTVPDGWELFGYPYAEPPAVVTFRLDETDVAYLQASNPRLTFGFVSTQPPTISEGWAGEVQSVVAPTAVPEPSALLLTAGGLAGLAGLARRRAAGATPPGRRSPRPRRPPAARPT